MISPRGRKQLTELALRSINHRLQQCTALVVDTSDYPPELCEIRSSFVTLYTENGLRGCIGSLVATHPLVQDVCQHAHAAAFKDPRFDSLTEAEFGGLHVHLSVLSPSEQLRFDGEAHLLSLLKPGRDGLTIKDGRKQGTFLPSVWEKLPDAVEFLAQLKLKAGLSRDYWSDSLIVERYTTESW